MSPLVICQRQAINLCRVFHAIRHFRAICSIAEYKHSRSESHLVSTVLDGLPVRSTAMNLRPGVSLFDVCIALFQVSVIDGRQAFVGDSDIAFLELSIIDW